MTEVIIGQHGQIQNHATIFKEPKMQTLETYAIVGIIFFAACLIACVLIGNHKITIK